MSMGNSLAAVLAAGCLLESTNVVLVGRRIDKEIRSEAQAGGRFLNVPILSLTQPICVRESTSATERKGVKELRLAASSKKVFENMKALLNAKVDVEGTISLVRAAQGPNVLLTVRAIQRRAARD